VLPFSFAVSSQIAQLEESALKPPAEVAPMERRPRPWRPAAVAPVGETWLATAISTEGRDQGVIWRRASFSSNQSDFAVTVSPRSSGTITSSRSEEHTSELQSRENL